MQLTDPELLNSLIREPSVGFEQTFQRMGPRKEALRPFLVYVDKVLEHYMSIDTQELNCIHLHFPEIPSEIRDALLEFLVIRMFHRSTERDHSQDGYTEQRAQRLNNRLIHDKAPSNAKATKGGNPVFRHWQAARNAIKDEMRFLGAHPQKSFRPETIFNILGNDLPVLEGSYYAVATEELQEGGKLSYNLLNADLDIEGVMKILSHNKLLSNIRQVILYDSDTRSNVKTFRMSDLTSLRARGYPIQLFMIFSFDKRPFRMRTLINKLTTIYNRYFISPQQSLVFRYSYIFEQEELDHLLSIQHRVEPVRRVGHSSELYIDYLELTKELGLTRLRSISMVNVYAMAMNKGLADVIMTRIKAEIDHLDTDEQEDVQRLLNSVLELVIKEWTRFQQEFQSPPGKGAVGFVVPWGIMDDPRFSRSLKALLPDRKVNLYTWKDVRDENCKDRHLLIVAYRDPGRYPFDIYPSLIEGRLDQHGVASPILFNMLFGDRYDHATFYYIQTKAKLLGNAFRYRHLDWQSVQTRIEGSRPHIPLDLSEEEDDDEIPDSLDSIKVRYVDGSSNSYYPSRPMIVQRRPGGPLEVLRMEQILEDMGIIAMQPLDELHADFNPFEVTPNNEMELQVIKEEYDVSDPKQSLWKVLLARRRDQLGSSMRLYEALEEIFKEKEFVRYGYFRDHWLDAASNLLVPRKRRHFRRICDYLELPSAYYRLELKKRASLANSSRRSTVSMNGLLRQMFKEGLFEPGVDIRGMDLHHLIDIHDLEEVGIDEENVNSELSALVELLRDKLHLKQIQKIDPL